MPLKNIFQTLDFSRKNSYNLVRASVSRSYATMKHKYSWGAEKTWRLWCNGNTGACGALISGPIPDSRPKNTMTPKGDFSIFGRLREQSSRLGIGEVECIARSAASTIRNLHRSCNERFPIVAQRKTAIAGGFAVRVFEVFCEVG